MNCGLGSAFGLAFGAAYANDAMVTKTSWKFIRLEVEILFRPDGSSAVILIQEALEINLKIHKILISKLNTLNYNNLNNFFEMHNL